MTIKHLVIPGGGHTGFQALGSLQHLEKNGYWNIENIESIYATSAGAIISLLISLKFEWQYINDYMIDRPWHETYQISAQNIFDAYSKKGLFDEKVVDIFYKPFFNAKDLSLQMTMKEFYEYSQIELHFFSLEMNTFEIIDISYKSYPDIPVVKAVLMSCAIPIIISPVYINEKCFVDGGVITNYPLKYCIQDHSNLDEILGIQNIYIEKENDLINLHTNILDYIIHFITKLIIKNNSNDNAINTNAITNELFIKTTHMSLSIMKEILYSAETRKKLLEEGIHFGEEFLTSKQLY
jgi:NTE family protein